MGRSNKEAISFDCDGVLVSWPPIQVTAIKDFIKYGRDIYLPPSEIPIISRNISSEPLGRRESLLFSFSKIGFVWPSVRRELPLLEETDKYINTGRPSKKVWVDMTRATLQRGHVLEQFDGMFFRPPGVPILLSKLAAVAELQGQYDRITHVDDNPADALPIAAKFPDVQVIIIQDLTTGVLFCAEERKRYPNVIRVASFREAMRK